MRLKSVSYLFTVDFKTSNRCTSIFRKAITDNKNQSYWKWRNKFDIQFLTNLSRFLPPILQMVITDNKKKSFPIQQQQLRRRKHKENRTMNLPTLFCSGPHLIHCSPYILNNTIQVVNDSHQISRNHNYKLGFWTNTYP